MFLLYFFDNKTNENILKLSFSAIRRPFKLQRSNTQHSDQFLYSNQNVKNKTLVLTVKKNETNISLPIVRSQLLQGLIDT